MRTGDQIRIIGSGGAPALLTVGRPFEPPEIQAKLASGEWRLVTEQEPDTEPRATGGTTTGEDSAAAGAQPPGTAGDGIGKPAQAAPKAEWIDHVVRARLMSREDAENYTKADLIEMCS
ncbi:hypothetical protein [Streptomyces sp. NPDC057854]|uniref:hypothetical protein n=1 Tax=unclassified Streptomyces TaxID=2593676 RepID=UPI0036CF5D75